MTIRHGLVTYILAGSLLLAGCGSKPAGDVAATVDGNPITKQDVDFEIAAIPGAQASDSATRNRVLAQIINRRMLAKVAKDMNVDQLPDYAAAERKARETVMVDLLSKQLVGADFNPDEKRIQAYIARNPTKFGDRQILALQQLRVPLAGLNSDWLRTANSLDEAATILTQHGIKFERGSATADTSVLPPPILEAVTKHPNDPFAVPSGKYLLISQVAGHQTAPLAEADARQAATAMIRREAFEKTVAAKLAETRSSAKIVYENGFDAADTATSNTAQ